MTATPTQDTITARLEELLAKATRLPWRYMDGEIHHPYMFNGSETWDLICTAFSVGQSDPEDGRLIVEAINALPALLSERSTLKAELEEARGVLSDFMENPLFQVAVGGNPNMVDALLDRARAYLTREPTNGR